MKFIFIVLLFVSAVTVQQVDSELLEGQDVQSWILNIDQQLKNLKDSSRAKRFLESIFGKKTTTTHYYYSPITTKTTPYYNARSSLATNNDPTTDAFYILKKTCSENYDSSCKKHKTEMYDLVVRCLDLKKKSNDREMVPACKEILSAYCYVFSSIDIMTCIRNEHDVYIPGKRTIATTAKTSTRSTIKINIITKNLITTTTTRSTTTTTTTTTTLRTNPPKTNKTPFELIPGFTGRITTIPTDANILKEIGFYCVKPDVKDSNCDKMLLLLKEKFKTCEKLPASDAGCQEFKKNFCIAYPTFSNCKKPSKRMINNLLEGLMN